MSYIGMKELEQTTVIPHKGMKGPLSYDNCKGCKSQCEHAGKDRTFCYRGKSCKVTVVTNADRIRAMSDEELAESLDDWQDWGGGLSKEVWLEWLQQPAEELL